MSTVETTNQTLSTSLPADPFTALAVSFGMLLGVTDFEALAANPRGKLRLHNAWLHGQGVVWGYGVTLDEKSREVRVEPGFALDAVGHELQLDLRSCVDIGAWYDEQSKAQDWATTAEVSEGGEFVAHVVARFRACFAQPVPAMASPCAGSPTDTAYSRVMETVELFLRPGPAPARDTPYPRVRTLFGLPVDQAYPEVAAALGALGSPPSPQDWLDALHTLAADDVIAMSPLGLQAGHEGSSLLFTVDEPTDVVLAQLNGVALVTDDAGARTATCQDIDTSVRVSHVSTTTITDLLTAILDRTDPASGTTLPDDPTDGDGTTPPSTPTDGDGNTPPSTPTDGEGTPGAGTVIPSGPTEAGPDAGGPRVDGTTMEWTGHVLNVAIRGSIWEGTLADGITVAGYEASAANPQWVPLTFQATIDDGDGDGVQTLAITPDPDSVQSPGDWVRIVVWGTGTTPVLGTTDASPTPVPFAGDLLDPPSGAAMGRDVAYLLPRSQK